MIAWSRLPMARSRSGISAIFASTVLSPFALSAFSSWTRSFIAARSSSVNPLNVLPVAVVLLADFWVPLLWAHRVPWVGPRRSSKAVPIAAKRVGGKTRVLGRNPIRLDNDVEGCRWAYVSKVVVFGRIPADVPLTEEICRLARGQPGL